MKKIGYALLIIGLVGLAYFGYEALQASESFNFLGVDVAVSEANWTPVILSGIVAVLGIILSLVGKKR
ncbi:MAG: transglycosylase [Marinilabiliaceae bacterium]